MIRVGNGTHGKTSGYHNAVEWCGNIRVEYKDGPAGEPPAPLAPNAWLRNVPRNDPIPETVNA